MISDVKSADVIVTVNVFSLLGDTGSTLRYVDNSNYLFAYHDGVNCELAQVVGGAPAVLLTAAAAFVADAPITVILDGLNARLYYNNVLIGITAVINSVLLTSTKFGLYSSTWAARISALTVYARGTDGEYDFLEQF